MFQDFMIIFNKGNIYCFDFFNEGELSMKKPLLFTPQNKHQTILCSYNNYLYLIGRMKDYDDTIIFKTHIQNFDKKSQYSKEPGYEVIMIRINRLYLIIKRILTSFFLSIVGKY